MKYGSLILAIVALTASLSGQTVPTGFFTDTLVASLSEPVGLAFLPDGRLLIIEQRTAAIKVWTGGATASLVGTVPGVNSSGNEQGLLAIAVDPQWPTRPYIYVWFDSNASANLRLAMFTVTGDLSNPSSTNLALSTQFNIMTDTPDNASNHNGGALRFGNDGHLYLSIGDDAGSCNAQNLSSGLGCLLRISVANLPGAGAGPPAKSTLIPAGNPFSGPTDNARLVWLWGLRNPFRFHIDSVTGFLYVADVGLSSWEEVSESTMSGQNLGWPWFEGNAAGGGCGGSPPASPLAPIATWSHATGAAAIISAGRYRNPVGGAYNFGATYEGNYFYSDYYVGALRRMTHNGVSWSTPAAVPGQPNANDWGTGFDTVSDFLEGPDGAIYYVRQFAPGFAGPGSLRRIRANPNAPMLSIVSGNNQPGNAGRPLDQPLVVRLTTIGGTPIAGGTVNFVPITGGGSTNPPSVMSDAQGYAQTTYTLPVAFSATPTISAASSGAAAVNFTANWRGLIGFYIPSLNYLSLSLRHSQTNSAFTLCWETPPQAGPLPTPFGDIWTSVLLPQPGLGAIDGLGLLGPPDPNWKTGPVQPTWSLVVSPLPLFGGVPFLFQAYAVDTALLPAASAIVISNPFSVTLN